MTKRTKVSLPVDKNGNPVDIGDKIYLKHNGKVRTVTSLVLHEDGSWIVGCDEGGAFLLPESQSNVTVFDETALLKDKLREVILACVTVADVRNRIPVLGCDETFLEDWLSEHEGELVLGETYQKALDLIKGLKTCADEDADARDCPLYDEEEPYRCRRERYMADLEIEDE